ncbi:MAG: phosphohistidine phosphatase SixA [Candidatus Ancaeobacter aquaticus]|nr:phosphohistidine phosphatase SixA [Candidatus Ancaeobacter aquaticus]
MYLLLIRHGDSENTKPGMTDNDRTLTLTGFDEIKSTARVIKSCGFQPDSILVSPYVRAQETAHSLTYMLDVSREIIETEDDLVPSGRIDRLLKKLDDAFSEKECIALVGHQPFMGDLMSKLLLGNVSAEMPFSKGAIAVIEVEGSLTGDQQKMILYITPSAAKKI